MEYTVQNLEYAVSVFYSSEQNERVQAHQWLTAAQRCPEAWSFVWELLQPTKGTEVQFFAATTLHTKLLRCWNEVPPESYEELRNKILQVVLAYTKGPKIVLNRLCISLAAFILQQGSEDLISTLQPLSTAEDSSLLLEALTVIPEEFYSMTMGSALRARNRAALARACPHVLGDMLRYLQSAYSDTAPSDAQIAQWQAAAQCAGSWLALGAGDDGGGGGGGDELPLCRALLRVVATIYNAHDIVSGAALEACEAALTAARGGGGCGGGGGGGSVARGGLALLHDLAALAEPIMAKYDVRNSINEELLAAITTCCVALTETHSRWLVEAAETRGEGAAVLSLLLQAQAAPGFYPLHEARSQLVFPVWYTLQDEVLCRAERTHGIHRLWAELFARLLRTLVTKSESPPPAALARDDRELLRCYRQDVHDTVMNCFAILGAHSWAVLAAAWADARSPAAREAALHALLALGDTPPQLPPPPPLLALLESAVAVAEAPDCEPRLLSTALECLGAYACWLAALAGSPLPARALRAAGAALPRAAAAAARCLRSLARECAAAAGPLAHCLVEAAQSGVPDAWARRQLLSACGAALCVSDAGGPLLEALAVSLRDELTQQISTAGAALTAAAAAAALLDALAPRPELALALARAVLPALAPYAERADAAPSLFLILKQTVSVLMEAALPLLPATARLARAAAALHPCAHALDYVTLVALMFHSEWSESAALYVCVVSLAARAAAAGAAGAAAGAGAGVAAGAAGPDVTEAVFAALQAAGKKRPALLDAFPPETMAELVGLAIECLTLWEASAMRAAAGFLARCARARPALLAPRAAPLVATALRALGGAVPRNQVEPLADLLLSLNQTPWHELAGAAAAAGGAGGAGAAGAAAGAGLGPWLRAALAAPGFPTPHATDESKGKFIQGVLREKSSKRRMAETVQEFSLACRGLVGTEYARQALSSRQLVA